MLYETKTHAADVEILKRPPFEGIPVTLDFTNVTAVNGKKVVKAGSPIGKGEGTTYVVDNTATVEGILLHDVEESRPIGTILKKAYINTSVAQTHSGVTIAAAAKGALPMVIFE